MPIRLDGDNATATPGITGGDADTGLVFGTDEIEAVTGGTTRFTVENNGNVTIENGNLVLASGSGIDFSATADGSGTTTSELLDDYEEGTWTPTASTATSVTYTRQTGKYTKIGRIVYIWFDMMWSSLTGTANPAMGGLPYSALTGATEGGFGALSIRSADGLGIDLRLNGDSSYFEGLVVKFEEYNSSGVPNNSVYQTGSGRVTGSGFYYVS